MTESNAEMFQAIVEIPLNGITVESPERKKKKKDRGKKKKYLKFRTIF